MIFHPGDAVRTPDAIGHIVHILPDGISVMMVNYPKGKDTYSGTYDHPYTERSKTVSKIYQEKELEKIR
jgi:hypothetical protein